jgi:type II secretion system protein D
MSKDTRDTLPVLQAPRYRCASISAVVVALAGFVLTLSVGFALAQEETPAPAPAVDDADAAAGIRFQFHNVPYADAVQGFAQMTGKALIGEIEIPGTLTFADPNPYTYADALDTLNLILSMKGVVLIETERYLRVAPKSDLPQLPLKIFRGIDGAVDVRPGEMVTVVLPLAHADAVEIAKAAQLMLTGAGTVTALEKGRGVVVTDRFDTIQRIKKLVVEVDVEIAANRTLKTVRLVNASGAVLAQIIERTFGSATAPRKSQFHKDSWKSAPPNPEDYVTVSYDEPSRTLVLFGPSALLKLSDELIARYEEDSSSVGKITVFYPRSLGASELAEMIRTAVPGVATAGESADSSKNKARIIADGTRKRLIVMAPVAEQLQAIGDFIRKIDGGTADAGEAPISEEIRLTRVLRVEHGDVGSIAKLIRQVTATPGPGALVAHEDSSSASIVVVGSPGAVQLAEQIYAQLDARPPDPEPRRTRLFALSGEDVEEASRIAAMAGEIYKERLRDAKKGSVADGKFLADSNGRRLIVTARESHLPIIEEIINTVRTPPRSTPEPRRLSVVALDNARVADVLSVLEKILTERVREGAWRDTPRPLVLPDSSRNRLLVTSTADQLEEIKSIVKQLDADQPVEERTVRVIETRGLPNELMPLVRSLLDLSDDEESPELVADDETRRLHVLATAGQQDRIAALVEQLDGADRPPVVRRETRVVTLESQDAAQALPIVEKLYAAQLDGLDDPEGGRATIVRGANEKTVLVTGPAAQIEIVEALLTQLDSVGGEESIVRVTRSIAINADQASTLVGLVSKVYAAQFEGQDAPAGGRATLLASSDDRRIFVTGPVEQIAIVEGLVEELVRTDRPRPAARLTRTIEVSGKDTEALVSLVERLYAARLEGRDDPEGGRATLLASGDDRRILVTGPEEQIAIVEELVGQIDVPVRPEVSRLTRAIDVQSESASEVVSVIQKLYTAQLQGRTEPFGGRATVLASSDDRRILVTGPADQIDLVTSLVAQIDTPVDDFSEETRIVRLRVADVDEIASLLEHALNRKGKRGMQVRIQTDARSRSLVLSGKPEALDEASQIISQLDVAPELQPRELRVVELRGGDATQTAGMVREIFEQEMRDRHGPGYTLHARIIGDSDSNRIVLSAPRSEMERLAEIVESLRTTRRGKTQTRAFDLQHANAESVARILRQSMTTSNKRGRPVERVQVAFDAATNTVVVTGDTNDVEQLATVITELDVSSEKARPTATRFLQFANAQELEQIAPLLEKLYERELAGIPDDDADAQFLQDADSARLIVTARPEHFERIDSIHLRLSLERDEPDGRKTRFFSYQDRDELQRVYGLARKVYSEQRSGDRSGRDVATILVDNATRQLIVTGSEEEIARVAAVLQQIGTSERKPVETRIFPYEDRDELERVSELARKVYADQRDADRSEGPAAALLVDSDNRQLIVTGSAEEITRIEAIIEQIGTSEREPTETRIFRLQTAQSDEIIGLVRSATRNLTGGSTLSIDRDGPSNSLIISGPTRGVESAATVIKELDRPITTQGSELRIIELKNGSATSIATIVRETFHRLMRDRYGARYEESASVIADDTSNRLVITAPTEQLEELVGIVEQLDQVSVQTAGTRIFKLEFGDADKLASVLSAALVTRDSRGREIRSANVSSDANTNTIVVSGAREDLQAAAMIITQLDADETAPDRELLLVEIASGEAATVASLAGNVWNEKHRGLSEVDEVQFIATGDGHRIALVAPVTYLEEATKIVRDLDTPVDSTQSELRIIELENGSATAIASTIEESFHRLMLGRQGARYEQVARVVGDDSTNRLVITAPSEQLEEIVGIVAELDQATSQSAGTRIFKLEFAEAEKVASVLSTALVTKNARGIEIRRANVSFDATTNNIVVSGSREDIQAATTIVKQLDVDKGAEERGLRIVDLRGELGDERAGQLAELAGRVWSEKYGGSGGANHVEFTASPDGRRMVVVGPESQLEAARELVVQLQAPGLANARQLFTVPLKNREAVGLEPLVKTVIEERLGADAGVSVTADDAARRLVIVSSQAEMETIREIVAELDKAEDVGERETRVYDLKASFAPELAKNVTDLFKEESKDRGNIRPDNVLVLGDGATNRLIVRAPGNEMALIDQIIQRLDEVTTQTADTRVFRPKIADVDRIGMIISQTLTKQVGPLTVPRVSVGSDRNSNVLVVSGEPKDLRSAAVIVESLDTAPTAESRILRSFPMREDVVKSEMAIRALYESHVRSSLDTAPPNAAIVPDPASGRMIVTATESHMKVIEQIIGEFNVDLSQGGRVRRLVTLKSASATVIEELLKAIFQPAIDSLDPKHSLRLARTPDDLGIVVQGPEVLVNDIETLVAQVEQENRTTLVEIRTYNLENSKAIELAETLTRLFAESTDEEATEKKGSAPRFEALQASNQLLVAAQADQFTAIESTLENLKASTELASQTRTFVLKGGDADSVSDVLETILIDESNEGDGPVVKVSAASGLNAVVVQGPPEKIALAEQLVRGLDEIAGSNETVVQTVKVKRGEAAAIARAVNNALEDRGLPGKRVRVTAEPNSNSLLLEGPKNAIPEVLQIIQSLDDESTGGNSEVRSFKVQNGEASQIASAVENLVEAMIDQRVSRADISTPPFTITADERGNSLVVYTQPPYFDVVEKLLVELDKAPENTDRTVQFVPLRHISAYTVRRQLTAIYSDRVRRDRPVIEADPFGNSLTILGRQTDIDFIEDLVEKIDQAEPDDEVLVRVLPLGQIPAADIASLLVNIYAQIAGEKIELRKKLPRRRQIYDKGFRRRVDDEEDSEEDSESDDDSRSDSDSSSSDDDSSSSEDNDDSSDVGRGTRHGEVACISPLTTLLVAAMLGQEAGEEKPPEKESAEEETPAGTNEDVDAADESVEADSEEADGADDETDVGDDKVILTIDSESNSLLLSGPRSDLDKIEDLIRKLTFNFETGDFEFRIFKLREASPVAVSTLLDNLFNIKVPSSRDSKGNETLPRPKITVVVDQRSRSVIVRALPGDFVLIEDIVRDLDSGGVGTDVEFRRFPLAFALPRRAVTLVRSLVDGLDQARPGEGVVILADPRTRSLLVAARPELYAHIQEIIARVDTSTTDAENDVVFVRLWKASASSMAVVLRNMLRPDSGGGASADARALQEQVRLLRVRNDAGLPVVLDLTRPIKILVDTQGGDGGNRLIISSTPDNVRALEAVAKMLDTVPVVEGVTVQFQRLERADATVVASTLRQIFQGAQSFRSPNGVDGEPEGETGQALVRSLNVAVDARTNTLILSGDPASVSLALAVVADLDQEGESFVTDVRLFRLRHASVTALLPVLRAVFTESTSVPGSAGLSTQVTRLRALMPESEPKATTLPRGRAALTIQAETTTNTLIVAARSDTMPLIEDVIKTLDIPAAAALNFVRIYPLAHANAATIQKVINDLQSGAKTLRVEDRAVVSVDSRTNALVVAGNERSFSFITALVFQLDKAGDPAVGLAVIPLKYNDSVQVATVIRQLFLARQRGRASDGVQPSSQDRVDIYPDRLTNALVISAGKENFELVRGLVESIDVAPVADGGVLRIFPLEHADAQYTATMLGSVVRQGLYRPGLMAQTAASRASERVAIGIDPRTNSIIISASPKNMAVIEQLLGELDKPSMISAAGIRVFQVEHASVGQLAPTLQEFFEAKRAGELALGDPERRVAVSIIPDIRTNTLLVAGSRQSFEAIEHLLKELDTEGLRAENIYRVFPLIQASAVKLQSTLEQLFDNRPRRLGQPIPQPITVVADRWVNALLVSALPEDLEIIQSLVERLDAVDSGGDQVRVIPIVRANASSVAQTITSLFATGSGNAVSAVQVGIDERLNALVISAGDGDYDRIVELVKQLDSDLVARVSEIRVFPLRHASATELARILMQAVSTKPESLTGESEDRQTLLQLVTRSADGHDLISTALQEGVLVTPDTRTNSLVVSAPVANLPLIQQLIYKLDTSAPQLAKIKVFSLINADAADMARILIDLFRLTQVTSSGAGGDSEGRSVRYVLSAKWSAKNGEPPVANADDGYEDGNDDPNAATVGTAEQDSLVVTVDGRTNSLILGGTDHYVALASGIIEQLDSSPALERRTQVYRLRNARATDISEALGTFFQQSQAGGITTVGDQLLGTSVQRQLEQEVSLVGEPNSNTLLVTASPRYFEEVARIIEELDQPQPQVLIQALIAEVTLDDATSLGVEFDYVGAVDGRPIDVVTDFGVVDEIASFGGLSAILTGGDLNSVLRALQSDGRLEVLSRPQILAVDNQTAEINIGQSVPQITGSQTTELGNINNTVEYRDVGVILRVTPRISLDGFVRLEVEPEISSLSSSSISVGQSGTAPIFNERKAQTTVNVRDGHTIMIGGLISTDDDVRDDGVPILKSIPVLGLLFRDRTVSRRRTELIIVLTPQIITTIQEADAMTRRNLEQSSVRGQEDRDEVQQRLVDELLDGVDIENRREDDPDSEDIDVDGEVDETSTDE